MAKGRLLLGLDLGSHAVKVVQLRETKKDMELQHFATAVLPPDAVVDGVVINKEAVCESLKSVLAANSIKTKEIALSVSGHSVITKKITLKTMSADDLEKSIKWEAEQYIPFDIKEVNVDAQILSHHESGGQMDVLLVAAKKDVVEGQVNVVRDIGLKPMVVDVDGFAVQNMFERTHGFVPGEVVVLLNIGASIVNIMVISGGVTAFTRDISLGGNLFTDEIQKQLGISREEAEAYKMGGEKGVDADSVIPQEVEEVIFGVADQVVAEIQRSLDFYAATSPEGPIVRVHVCGGTARLPGVIRVLGRRLGVPVEVINPLENILVDENRFNMDMIRQLAPVAGVAVGLALRRTIEK